MRTVRLHGEKAAGRVALVDDADYDLVVQYRWNVFEHQRPGHFRKHGPYAHATVQRGGRPAVIKMHKLITGYARTDHWDHDGLNNQRSNLRDATVSQNGANQRAQPGRSSHYKGVNWHIMRKGRPGKWRAEIWVRGERRYLGLFACEEDAARAYDAAAREAFGEFACTNL